MRCSRPELTSCHVWIYCEEVWAHSTFVQPMEPHFATYKLRYTIWSCKRQQKSIIFKHVKTGFTPCHGWCNRREPLPLFFLFVAELACSFRMSSENLPTKRFKNTGVPPHSGEKMAVLSWPACCLCWSHQGDFHHTTLGKEAAWIRQPTVSKRKTHSGLQTSTVALLQKGLIQTHVSLARSNPTKITTLKRQLHSHPWWYQSSPTTTRL